MISRVTLTKSAEKQLRKVPRHVVIKLKSWVELVAKQGLEEARKIPGYHDEPLAGPRYGQRSIRLSQAYRAIYVIHTDDNGHLVSVEEVSKHGY